jgi:hypothetical protein
VKELSQVMTDLERQDGSVKSNLLSECSNILTSLRMLSLNAVKCIVEWRKQLLFNYMLTLEPKQQINSTHMRKLKTMPFIWEHNNYLIKMKTDSSFLFASPFARYFSFSAKSDTFLVFPSMKSTQTPATKKRVTSSEQTRKLMLPIQSSLLKVIRQSEVYIMEEAVTDILIRSAQQRALELTESSNPA